MSESDGNSEMVTVRFALKLGTEDPAYVDVTFKDERQARKAIGDVLAANGPLVQIKHFEEVPVLLRSADVSAAYPIDIEDDEEDEDD